MKRFVEAFAQAGDKTEVPNTTQGNGSVSYPTGYGPDYEKNLDSDPDAKRIERQKMNQVFNDITTNIKLWQEQGYPMFVSTADNDGSAMPYKKGMKVVFTDGNIYQSLIDNNNGTPATDHDKWSQVSGIDGEYVTGGTYKIGDIVTASNGNQYWCRKANNGASPIDPKTDNGENWCQYPESLERVGAITVIKKYNGLMTLSMDNGSIDFNYTPSAIYYQTVTFPVTFSSKPFVVVNTVRGNVGGGLTTTSAETIANDSFRLTYSNGETSALDISMIYSASGRWYE